jgi:pimeloyl-ACP methyl ester carboxylesterase
MLRSALFWSIPLLLICGCTQMLAERVAKAPNRQMSVGRGVDAPADELKKLFVDEQLRLSVGPPDASISVWITDPTIARETIALDRKGRAIIKRKPTTAPATQPLVTKGTVFLLHGIADRKEFGPYMIYREILTHDGYRVVQVDLRGHGRSTGDFITFGVVESRDLVQLLDSLESQGKIIGPVGVLGVSYGASVAIEWAAIDPRIKAIVALEPFATFRQVSHDAGARDAWAEAVSSSASPTSTKRLTSPASSRASIRTMPTPSARSRRPGRLSC